VANIIAAMTAAQISPNVNTVFFIASVLLLEKIGNSDTESTARMVCLSSYFRMTLRD